RSRRPTRAHHRNHNVASFADIVVSRAKLENSRPNGISAKDSSDRQPDLIVKHRETAPNNNFRVRGLKNRAVNEVIRAKSEINRRIKRTIDVQTNHAIPNLSVK